MLRRFREEETGIAMITVLLALIILSGLAVVFVNRAVAESRASSFSQDYESALHVGEAAADVRIAMVRADPDHVTTDALGAEFVLPDGLDTPNQESAWAVGLLDEVRYDSGGGTFTYSPAWIDSIEGEAYAIRPRSNVAVPHPSGVGTMFPPSDRIYAVSAVPGFDAPRPRVRVLKLQVDQASFIPRFAFLTEGEFRFAGNAAIVAPGCDPSDPDPNDCYADVHTNQGYDQSGNSSVIHGAISTSSASCPSGTTATLGCTPGAQPQPIPEIRARDYYIPNFTSTSADSAVQPVKWYDLCPNGQIRPGSTTSTTPCTGEPVEWTSTGGNTRFRGWRWQAGQNEWQANSVAAGVYYVHNADASIQGSEGNDQHSVTVIVEQDPANPGNSGSLDVSGNPKMQAAAEGLLFITDGDLDMNGSATGGTCGESPAAFSGLMAVGEQFNTQGTVELRGAVIVQDRADDHGLVRRNNASVGGTMCLEFDKDLSVSLAGQWVVTFWNEL